MFQADEAKVRAIPLGRPARLDEVTHVLRSLCHPSAGYFTGQVVTMSGGVGVFSPNAAPLATG